MRNCFLIAEEIFKKLSWKKSLYYMYLIFFSSIYTLRYVISRNYLFI